MWEHHVAFSRPDEEAKIWRYMNIPKFLSIITRNQLFFPNLSTFDDPCEGLTPAETRKDYEIFFEPYIHSEDDQERVNKQIESLMKLPSANKDLYYVSCWHLNIGESDAMWRLYSKLGEGIAIQSTYDRFRRSLNSAEIPIHIGMIKYIDYSKEKVPIGNIFFPLLRKRLSFIHEQEIRAVAQIEREDQKGFTALTARGIYFPIDLDILIDSIYISPKSPLWIKEMVMDILEKYEIKKNVIQSDLYSENLY